MKILFRDNTSFEAVHIEGGQTADGRNKLQIYSDKHSFEELMSVFQNNYNNSRISLDTEVIERLEFDSITSNRRNQFIVTLVQADLSVQAQVERLEQTVEDLQAQVGELSCILSENVQLIKENASALTMLSELSTQVDGRNIAVMFSEFAPSTNDVDSEEIIDAVLSEHADAT